MNVKLTIEEILFGAFLDNKIADARATLREREQAKMDFIQFLGNKYGLNGDVTLENWIGGFNTSEEVHDGELHNQ